MNEVETKFISIIDEKLGEKIEVVEDTEKVKKQDETYKKVLAVPAEIKKIMKEVRNDEKIEDDEMERRMKNFVIHGTDEIGGDADEVQKNDDQYIKSILRKIGVKNDLENVTRLGKPNEQKKRTIKVVMKSSNDKDRVLSNLRKLKGTEEEFGKISVTSDYTKSERDQIKSMVEKAKAQSASNANYIYKVRGTPKNGLRIVSFAKT